MSTNRIDGTRLKQSIKQAGYTLDEFHKELGIAKTTFYYYRTGARPIPRNLRQRVEALLQCSFHDFLIPQQEITCIVLPVAHQGRSKH
jgi:transcriptional regulator with XRE-family HTH domain